MLQLKPTKSSSFRTTIVILMLGLSAVMLNPEGLVRSAHARNVSLSAFTTTQPVIDGSIGTVEWGSSANMSFTTSLGHFTGTIYVMNDATNLYLAVRMQDSSISSRFLQIIFDNNDDGTLEVGEDALIFNQLGPPDFDYFIPQISSTVQSLTPDTYAGGTSDGSVGVSSNGSFNSFEFSHPLCSSDITHDFCLHTGSRVGFNLEYANPTVASKPANYGFWPQTSLKIGQATGFGQISIAG